MGTLEGKVAIVTGASSGIGRAAARLFAREGAAVIVAARRAIELDSLAEDITQDGGKAVSLAGDVRDEAYANALVELAERSFGGLDIAFNNAGILGTLAPAAEISLEDWGAHPGCQSDWCISGRQVSDPCHA